MLIPFVTPLTFQKMEILEDFYVYTELNQNQNVEKI